MLKILIIIISFLAGPALAYESTKSSTMTSVKSADLWCGTASGGFYFDTINIRAWQGDYDDDDGVELTVLSIDHLACLGCINIQAELYIFGHTLHWDFALRGKQTSSKDLEISLTAKGTGALNNANAPRSRGNPIVLRYNCARLNSKS